MWNTATLISVNRSADSTNLNIGATVLFTNDHGAPPRQFSTAGALDFDKNSLYFWIKQILTSLNTSDSKYAALVQDVPLGVLDAAAVDAGAAEKVSTLPKPQ